MKSAAEQLPLEGEAHMAISRTNSRQGWLFVVLAIAVICAAVGFKFLRPEQAAKLPIETFLPAAVPAQGMVAQVVVAPGQHVRKGELLAAMEYSTLQAAVDAARQNLLGAISAAQAVNAPTAISAPVPGMAGGFEKRAVPIPRSSSLPPDRSVAPSTSAPPVLTIPKKGAILAAPSAVDVNESKIKDLSDAVKLDQAQIDDLQKRIAVQKDAADAAQALVTTVSQVAARTKADSDKSASLLAEGVISANEAAKSQSYSMQAQGQLQAAKVHAAEAEASLGESQRALDAANQDLEKKQTDLGKAQSQLEDAKKHPSVAQGPPSVTELPQQSLRPPEMPPKYKLVKINGPIANAPPPTPVQVNFLSPMDAVAGIQRAEAALEEAERALSSACIYAPADGVVMRILVRPGQIVNPGYQAFLLRN